MSDKETYHKTETTLIVPEELDEVHINKMFNIANQHKLQLMNRLKIGK